MLTKRMEKYEVKRKICVRPAELSRK